MAGTITTRISRSNHYWVTGINNLNAAPPQISILQYGHGYSPGGIRNGYVCPAITTSAWQLNNFFMTPIMDEPHMLTPQRTELAKQLRREGIESFSHRELAPREDGISNTLTSVQKDNLLIEPNQVIGSMQAHAYRGSVDGPAPCINAAAGMGGGHVPMVVENNDNRGGFPEINRALEAESYDYGVVGDYLIRRLTPRETFRLMDVYDDDIDKLLASGLSDNALYELAGNSIVVHCLYLIFRNMFISEFMAPPTAPPPKQLSLFAGFD